MLLKSQGHTRRLPTGRTLAKALRAVFRRQLAEVWPKIRDTGRVPSLRGWLPRMVNLCVPLTLPIWQKGGWDSMKRIARLLARGKSVKMSSKPPGVLGISFDVWNYKVEKANADWTYLFCQATLDTSELAIGDALAKLKEELLEGLEEGEAYASLSKRVAGIFNDPRRATQIAMTESTRAIHGGQLLLAQEAEQEGLKLGKEWAASSDACDACLAMEARGVIPLDENFAVVGTGPYAAISYPPKHPGCLCSMLEALL